MDGLTVTIERCRDGVELVSLPETEGQGVPGFPPLPARTVFRYRTEHRKTQLVTIANLEKPIVMKFVNATTDEKRRLFFGQFGLDWSGRSLWGREPFGPIGMLNHNGNVELRHDFVLRNQSYFREMLRDFSKFDPAVRMATVNTTIAERGFNLRPVFHLDGAEGVPHLLLQSESLIGFMMMEIAMVIANNARTAECEKCDTLFLTGPLTGRRSHARFCSDRCRVAAMRARNAERETSTPPPPGG